MFLRIGWNAVLLPLLQRVAGARSIDNTTVTPENFRFQGWFLIVVRHLAVVAPFPIGSSHVGVRPERRLCIIIPKARLILSVSLCELFGIEFCAIFGTRS